MFQLKTMIVKMNLKKKKPHNYILYKKHLTSKLDFTALEILTSFKKFFYHFIYLRMNVEIPKFHRKKVNLELKFIRTPATFLLSIWKGRECQIP